MKNTKIAGMLLVPLTCLTVSSHALAGQATCSVTVNGSTKVNGQGLWAEVPHASPRGNTPCEVDQFAWNNFLYLAADDGTGHPRFMSFAPWYNAMPASGAPVWTGRYAPLNTTELTNKLNQIQAGDGFELLDVAGRTVSYDIRINQVFFDYVAKNGLYTKSAIANKVKEYQANPSKGGIWLPPNGGSAQGTSVEIKTAWRDFGSGSNCPADIMHCEKDTKGNEWGLIGFHFVQKTPLHGEMIWASFEHVANAPDCTAGGSNPIQRFPVNPRHALPPVNANNKIAALVKTTGWNLFNFDSYQKAGGDGKKCTYPSAGGPSNPLCLNNPNPSGDGKTWVQVNVCRSDQLPPANQGSGTPAVAQQASDLNRSVVENFPSGLADKWKYYMLAGSEYVFWGSTGFGAPTVGCWSFADNSPPINCGAAKGEESVTVTREGSVNLANTSMETWMQKGISLKTAKFTLTQTDCFTCHRSPTTSFQGDLSHLFGRATQAGTGTVGTKKP